MHFRITTHNRKWRDILIWAALPALFLCLSHPPAAAFTFEKGEVSGSLNMTLGYGLSIRTEDGLPSDINAPNQKANFTFNNGVVANVFKALAEFQVDWRNYGVFIDASYSYDTLIMNRGTDRENGVFNGDLAGVPLDTGIGNKWSEGAKDASGSVFDLIQGYAYGTFIEGELDVRVGRQVIAWGEGLFFFDGVSQQVPLNFNKFVLPGSELKEAFLGLGAGYVQWAATDDLSLTSYYQWEWEKTQFPGVGTFYGDDILGPGGQEEWANAPAPFTGLRGGDIDARSQGQWGISGRYFLGGTEVGLYYSRYHDPLPMVTFSNGGATVQQTYLEDLDLIGASFATTLGTWSVNGEIAYRPNRPVLSKFGDFFFVQDGEAWEERDTVSASAHGLWLGGPLFAGIDSQFVAVQLGMDYINGDLSNLQPQGDITVDREATDPTRTAWGLAAEWDGTWQAVIPSMDITLLLFGQYDFSGNSHNWGNFAEGRLLYSTGLNFAYGSGWEFDVLYAGTHFDESSFRTRDTINFSVNYKF